MNRRKFLLQTSALLSGAILIPQIGCRGRQVAHVLDDSDANMVGSHEAGSETFTPLIKESVSKLLGRQHQEFMLAAHSSPVEPAPKRICFVGVENASAEEIGDFKEQIYELIDGQISQSGEFQTINRRYVEAGLRNTRLHPDELFIPDNMQVFSATMSQASQPFDYLLFAKLTSGTTNSNHSYQRDYLLTLELVDIQSGLADKETAMIRKGYHKSKIGKAANYGMFKWW